MDKLLERAFALLIACLGIAAVLYGVAEVWTSVSGGCVNYG